MTDASVASMSLKRFAGKLTWHGVAVEEWSRRAVKDPATGSYVPLN
jgi:hypothetical protein